MTASLYGVGLCRKALAKSASRGRSGEIPPPVSLAVMR